MRIARYVMPVLVPLLLLTIGYTEAAAAQDQDPPDRVGRLSFLAGDVSFRPAGVDEWTDAALNYPLTTGDDLWADAGSRAEIALGSAAVRLAPSTAFGFLALDDQMTQIRLTQGSLQVRLRNLADDESFEIDTPNGAVSLLQPGSYRVDVDANGDATTLTVRDGQAELTASGSAFSVDAGEAATVRGTDSPEYDVQDPRPPDAWEQWGVTRDRRRDGSSSAHYVSRDMPGYEDLDDYGDWRETPEYGSVWAPRRVAAGWAPYRNGHWAWVDPWGWTWIDDAPWGFAPYHYGRWVYVGNGWAWVPGHVVARPVYAPALVAFVGGSNFSISIGVGGGVGWFPLGPNEAYIPSYRVSDRYVRNINITTINVTNIPLDMTTFKYRNRGSPGGVTVVARETFVGARPVGRSLIVVPKDRLNSATIVGTAAPFAPTRASVLTQSGGPARRPPPASVTRRVVVRTAPPPPPVPFTAREQAMQGRPGRPLDDATLSTLRGRTPTADTRPVRSATGGGGPPLRPARQGLPAARPATPGGGGRRAGRVDRPTPPPGGQPVDRSAPPPRARPQPEPRPPVNRTYVPGMPTPPRLPTEEPQPARPPAQPPRQDRGRRPDRGQPQAEPRPTAPPEAAPTPAPPPQAAPAEPATLPQRGRRPGRGQPQAEPRPPAPPEAAPAPPPPPPQAAPAEPAAPPQRGQRPNRGQPQPEPRPPAPPEAAPAPAPPPQTAPAEPPAPAEPAAPPQRGRPSRPDRGGQDSSGNNQRPGRRGQDTSGNNPR